MLTLGNFPDVSSLSNIGQVETEKLDFEWTVDFDEHIIVGTVRLFLKAVSPDKVPQTIYLDTSKLEIHKISVLFVEYENTQPAANPESDPTTVTTTANNNNNNPSGTDPSKNENEEEANPVENDNENVFVQASLFSNPDEQHERDFPFQRTIPALSGVMRFPIPRWKLGEESPLGEQLAIPLAEDCFEHFKQSQRIVVEIDYKTSNQASGLQWLSARQTEGKRFPYLYTQFQLIQARSVVPCQDSPTIKAPYSAIVNAPKHLTTLMSARCIGREHVPPKIAPAVVIPAVTLKSSWTNLNNSSSSEGSSDAPQSSDVLSTAAKVKAKTLLRSLFVQPVPVPTCLLALVVGDLVWREIGPRTRVWTEQELLEQSVFEFSDVERYLKVAESFLTPYVWGQYDLLVLPKAFPLGGMENPTLTFVTPTLLSGDRSLASMGVITHEIAHSWTGNTVTGKTWSHFWLNEGFTVFIERRILGKIYGTAVEHMQYMVGNVDLLQDIEEFRDDHPWTTLITSLDRTTDPNESWSSVAYERGSQFLFYLESLVGSTKFEQFLRDWINTHKYGTVTSSDFTRLWLASFPETTAEVAWDAWLHATGEPPIDISTLPTFDNSLCKAAWDLGAQWVTGEISTADPAHIQGWNSGQRMLFLSYLLQRMAEIPTSTAQALAEYQIQDTQNYEITWLWLQLVIRAQWVDCYPQVVAFLKSTGRLRFLYPIYAQMFRSPTGKQIAIDVWNQQRDYYHSLVCNSIGKLFDEESN